jgi:hypothetical protein
MSDSETKKCPLCMESIRAEARKCPHCQTRLTRAGIWKNEILLTLNFLGYLAVLIAALNWMFPDDHANGLAKFSEHRDELRVIRPNLELGRQDPMLWLERHKTNLPPASITNGGTNIIEVRLLDAHDQVIEQIDPNAERRYGISTVSPNTWLTGFITNTGRYDWYVTSFEIQALDAAGHPLELERSPVDDGILVLAHRETAVRVPLNNHAFTNNNISLHIRAGSGYER